jgi:hypothetical protein
VCGKTPPPPPPPRCPRNTKQATLHTHQRPDPPKQARSTPGARLTRAEQLIRGRKHVLSYKYFVSGQQGQKKKNSLLPPLFCSSSSSSSRRSRPQFAFLRKSLHIRHTLLPFLHLSASPPFCRPATTEIFPTRQNKIPSQSASQPAPSTHAHVVTVVVPKLASCHHHRRRARSTPLRSASKKSRKKKRSTWPRSQASSRSQRSTQA